MTRTIRRNLSRLIFSLTMMFAAVAVVSTASDVAHAQPKWKLQQEAKKSYSEGKKKMSAGDYAGALVAFQDADAKWPGAAPKYNIAVCFDKLNQYAEAATAYRTFIDSKPGAKYADRVIAAGKRIAELETKIEGTVVLAIAPPNVAGMAVKVDGAPAQGPELKLKPGAHTIEVTAPGYQPFSQQVEVSGGAKVDLPVNLVATQQPKPQPKPSEGMSTAGILRISGFVAIGVAVVGGVLTGVFGAQALSAQSDFDATPTEELADDAESSALIADVFLGVSGAFGIAGIIMLAAGYTMEDTGDSGVQVLPMVGTQGGGVMMSVEF